VAEYREWLDALRDASDSVRELKDPAIPGRIEHQEAAIARLMACLKSGLPSTDEAQRREILRKLRSLALANNSNLKWTRMRAQLARIGLRRREAPKAPAAPRLDLVS
jgi:hypothetical protein